MHPIQRLAYPFAQRFVAGTTQDDALTHVDALNEDDVKGLMNILGEHATDKETAGEAVAAYESLLDAISETEVNASLSVKLTQLGLNIDREYCLENMQRLMDAAAAQDRFVWIDMESSDHTDDTLELFQDLHEDYQNIGVTVQCMLKRSQADLETLPEDANIRLVKGAYNEPADIAYTNHVDIEESYRDLLEYLFGHHDYVAVATHDRKLIHHAQQLEDVFDRPRASFEFQSLMGVEDGLERSLADDGYMVSEYVPYGPKWYPYFKRRLQERKNLALRHLHLNRHTSRDHASPE